MIVLLNYLYFIYMDVNELCATTEIKERGKFYTNPMTKQCNGTKLRCTYATLIESPCSLKKRKEKNSKYILLVADQLTMLLHLI